MALENFYLGRDSKLWANDGIEANDFRVGQARLNATVAPTTTTNFASLTGEYAFYISSNTLLRINIDGVNAASATSGLFVEPNVTRYFQCTPSNSLAVRVFNTDSTITANITVQFMKRV